MNSNSSDMTYQAQTISVSDYYPFGMLSRSYSGGGYRYGFNGKEQDNEIIGEGRWQDYGARMYRPDLARFFSPDPLIVYQKKYPELSSYQFASNTPIWGIDWDGLEAKLAIWAKGYGNESTFRARAEKFALRASTRTSVHGISTGKDFINLLKSKTKSEGSIASVIIFSHAFPEGVLFRPSQGFYTSESLYGSGENYRNVNDLLISIENNEIRFEDNAIVIFAGCNCAGYGDKNDDFALAQEFASKTGVTTIGSKGGVSPEIVDGKETGRLVSDIGFFKFEKQDDGSIKSISLGKIINPSDFDVDNTIQKIKPKQIKKISIKQKELTIQKK